MPSPSNSSPLTARPAENLSRTQGAIPVQHPVAGKPCRRPVHGGPHNPGGTGAARQKGDLPIGAHFSPGNLSGNGIHPPEESLFHGSKDLPEGGEEGGQLAAAAKSRGLPPVIKSRARPAWASKWA